MKNQKPFSFVELAHGASLFFRDDLRLPRLVDGVVAIISSQDRFPELVVDAARELIWMMYYCTVLLHCQVRLRNS